MCFLALGVLSSAAIAETLWKWGGTFTIAGFLFNGGLEGFKYKTPEKQKKRLTTSSTERPTGKDALRT